MPPLTIAVAQPSIVSLDVEANVASHADVVRSSGARVVVFPELSLTGYELAAPPVRPDDARLWPLIAACDDAAAVALVGAPIEEDGRSFIAMLAIDGSAARVAYRKMWLGGAEPERFTAGPAPAVLDVDGWRLGLAICKDTRIPEHAAATSTLGMDVYLGGITESADDAGAPAHRARRVAADHVVWVAIASFAGSTGGGFDATAGGSGIWRPDGQPMRQLDAEPGTVATATIESRVSSSAGR